jgi:hypothetical protein
MDLRVGQAFAAVRAVRALPGHFGSFLGSSNKNSLRGRVIANPRSMDLPEPPRPPAPTPQKPVSRPIWKRGWFWAVVVAVIVVIGAIGGSIGPSDEAASSSPTSEPAEEPSPTQSTVLTPEPTEEAEEPAAEPKEPTIEDGTWVVPDEVKPGIYRATTPGSNCYWERVKNFTGGLNSIIANGNAVGGPIVIEIAKSDKGFTSEGCAPWSSDLSRASASRTSVGDGMWIVGTDMAPGTYRTTVPGGNCYWARLRSFDGSVNSILANDLPGRGNAIVEIRPSDTGFETGGCGTWEKV